MAQTGLPQPQPLDEPRDDDSGASLIYPASEEMPEGNPHLKIRTILYQLIDDYLGPAHTVGSDQFVYWVRGDTASKLAPGISRVLYEDYQPCDDKTQAAYSAKISWPPRDLSSPGELRGCSAMRHVPLERLVLSVTA